jgi:hypothetical protein
VDDIDVALIRGAYKIKRIKLKKTGGKAPVPFFLQTWKIFPCNGLLFFLKI